MAKINTLINRDAAKLSDTEKATVQADKAIIARMKSGDVASLRVFRDRVNDVYNTLLQEGDKTGKRFNGAESHEFESQLQAFASTVIRGNIPRIG